MSTADYCKAIADCLWENHDFGKEVVKDYNGWEFTAGHGVVRCERVYFIDRDEQPSEKRVFLVRFQSSPILSILIYPGEQ